MKPYFTIEGIDALIKNLETLEAKASKKLVRQTLRKVAKDKFHTTSKANVPVAEGTLKKAIKIKAAKRSRTTIGLDVVVEEFAALPSEYGTQYQAPKAWMRRTFQQNEKQAEEQIITELIQGIERLAAEGVK